MAPGPIICLSPGDNVASAVFDAASGTTIAIAPGTYELGEEYALLFQNSNVTLRSASGVRDVTLEGDFEVSFFASIQASNVTLADLSLAGPIEVTGANEENTTGALLHNLGIHGSGQKAIIIKPNNGGVYGDRGTLRCSDFIADRESITDSTSALDTRGMLEWRISSNHFEGWFSSNGTVRSIYLFGGSRDNVIEGNTFVDFDIAIGLGGAETSSGDERTYQDAPCAESPGYFDDFGSIVRNNFLLSTEAVEIGGGTIDSGIGAWATCGAKIVHNTLVFPDTEPLASIEYRFAVTEDLLIANNLSSFAMRVREDATGVIENNQVSITDLAAVFRDIGSGDLHLLDTASNPARDKGAELDLAPRDIDGDERDDTPDLGADEIL